MAILQVNFLSQALFRTGFSAPTGPTGICSRKRGLTSPMKKARETTTGNSGTSISATSSTGCRWTRRKPASAAATS